MAATRLNISAVWPQQIPASRAMPGPCGAPMLQVKSLYIHTGNMSPSDIQGQNSQLELQATTVQSRGVPEDSISYYQGKQPPSVIFACDKNIAKMSYTRQLLNIST